MNNKKYTLIPLCIIFWVLPGCKKLVTVDPPSDQLVSGTIFNDESTALSALSGLYSELTRGGILSTTLSQYTSMSSDDIVNTTSSLLDEFSENNLSSGNSTVDGPFWGLAYKHIYQANAIIEGLEGSPIEEAAKNQLTGEAKFIRAFIYFYLVNLFGDVPLILSTDYMVNNTLPRRPAADIYNQIKSDLESASALLDPRYSNPEKIRASRAAAIALQARVSLYLKDYVSAESYATDAIENGDLSLAEVEKVFKHSSTETIFQLRPVPETANTGYPTIFVPREGQIPAYRIREELVGAFDPQDQRLINWTTVANVNGQQYIYPYKYKVRTEVGAAVEEYNVVLRMAELYLIRAESRLQNGNLSGAIEDVDVIRRRAGLIPFIEQFPSAGPADIAAEIEKENRLEYFAEWGHRWLDLKRTGMAEEALSEIPGKDWQSTDALYPIPLRAIIANPNLTQNPGYN